ncbi:hypothetical protein BH18ACT4_BH18ACT4_11970 [soil metagenome]
MRCEDISEVLAEAADGTAVLDLAARRHVEHCLRCQAEAVQYRKLLRALHALRTEVLEPAPGLVTDVLVVWEEPGDLHSFRSLPPGRWFSSFFALPSATAAGAAGAIVLASRSSRRRLGVAG